MNNYYENPVHRGFFPDPSVIRVGEDYYKVNSSFQYFPAIPISHSKDLVNWEIVGHAIVDERYLDLSETFDSRGIWAPDISYSNGKYYIFAPLRHNRDDKKDGPMRSQLIFSSDKPEGPYGEPIRIEVDDIDPSHFVDDDGKHYMIIAPGVTVVPLSEDCSRVIGEVVQVWPGTGERCPEGPHIFKHNGYYYAMLAEGGTGYGHRISVARSKNLYGTYEECPHNPLMRQINPDALIQRCGHGMLIDDINGEWWCLYLCSRKNEGNYTTLGRETALDKVRWTEDGWFTINNGNGPSMGTEGPDVTVKKVEKSDFFDDFTTETLNLNYEWVRNPDKTSYSLSEKKSHLRIYTQNGQLNEICAKNTLVHRETELKYEAETKLSFSPENGCQAGITCYYSTKSYISFSIRKINDEIKAVVAYNAGADEKIKEIVTVKKSEYYYLKIIVTGQQREFLFSVEGREYVTVTSFDNCYFLSDEGIPEDKKRHTGTMVGIYANNGGTGLREVADFDYFRISSK